MTFKAGLKACTTPVGVLVGVALVVVVGVWQVG